jgi:hypothetical protein
MGDSRVVVYQINLDLIDHLEGLTPGDVLSRAVEIAAVVGVVRGWHSPIVEAGLTRRSAIVYRMSTACIQERQTEDW